MNRTRCDPGMLAAGLVILQLSLAPSSWAGKLDAVRDAVRGGSAGEDGDDDQDSAGGDDSSSEADDSSSGGSWGLWAWCLFPPVGVLACLPRLGLEPPDDFQEAERETWIPSGYFLRRPYAEGRPGHVFMTRELRRLAPRLVEDSLEERVTYDPALAALAGMEGLSGWSVRIAAEYAHDFGPVHRPSLLASVDSIFRVGLTARWTHYLEPLGEGGLDHLGIGELNLTYRVAQSEYAEIRLGLGAQMISDGGLSFGFNFTYLVDIFPVDPLVISLVADLGNLGAAFTTRGRVTLGVQLGPAEPYVGYELAYFYSELAEVLFQGPVAGVRFWF